MSETSDRAADKLSGSDDLAGHADQTLLTLSISRLRTRAANLRIQAFVGLVSLVCAAVGIAAVFVALQRSAYEVTLDVKARDPYDYNVMSSRHDSIATRLQEISMALSDTKQELIADKYANSGRNVTALRVELSDRSRELAALKADLEERLSKDRQNMLLEIQQLKAERDRAMSEGVEKRSFIRLVGDAVMRVGVLVLAVYVISIFANIIKYWLRVADHLSSIADSIELCLGAQLSLDSSIKALTPHSIDFHVEDVAPLASLKDMVVGVRSGVERLSK